MYRFGDCIKLVMWVFLCLFHKRMFFWILFINQLMVNGWFRLVVWIPRIPLKRDGCLRATF